MFAFALAFQSLPPVLPLIISEFSLSYAESGLLMSFFALPGLFLALLGGFLSDRYGTRRLGMAGFLLLIVGTLTVAWGAEFWNLGLGRVVTGMGAFTLSVLLPKLLSQWFVGRELGLAMGVFNTAVPLGSVISFGLFGGIGNLWGWRSPLLFVGGYSLLTSLLFVSLCPSLPHHERREKTPGLFSSLKNAGLPIWWVGLAWLWFNAAFVSFNTFGPILFLENGYTLRESGLLIGITLMGPLFFSTPIGYLVDRFGKQEYFIAIGGIALSILMISFNATTSFLLLVILIGFFSAMVPSPIYSLPPELLKPETVGLGYGVITTCSSIGIFAGPYIVGRLRDLTGSLHWSFAVISLFDLFVAGSILFARRYRRG